jgi:hypothetical protein
VTSSHCSEYRCVCGHEKAQSRATLGSRRRGVGRPLVVSVHPNALDERYQMNTKHEAECKLKSWEDFLSEYLKALERAYREVTSGKNSARMERLNVLWLRSRNRPRENTQLDRTK